MQKQLGIQLTEGEQRPQCVYGIKFKSFTQ